MSIIYSIFIFLLVILVHEFGHFIVAKLNGVLVNEFSIGMGPEIISIKGEETQYSLRAFPIGGYVAMEGEEEDSNNPRSFNNTSPIRRILVIAAGAVMNFVLAIILFTIVFLNLGVPSTTIESTIPGSPAEKAGISSGDTIMTIDNKKVEEWADVSKILNEVKKETVLVELSREGELLTIEVNPIEEDGNIIIGVVPGRKPMVGIFRASISQTIEVVKSVFNFIIELVRGKASVSELSGPVGIVRHIGRQSSSGLMSLLFIAGIISANLGAFNLLPFPALDGGTIIITLIEMVTRREFPEKIKMTINLIGLTLLFSLILYVTIFNDILNPRI